MVSHKDFWTPAKDMTIKTCLDIQYSTYQIATKLKCSQGAVGRRIKKLGLKPAFGAPDMGSTFKRVKVEKAPKKEKAQKNRPVAMETVQPSSEVDQSVAAIFAGEGMPLADTRNGPGECRWPLDGAAIAQPRVCGASSEMAVYCPKHADIALRGARKAEDRLLNYSNPHPRTRYT